MSEVSSARPGTRVLLVDDQLIIVEALRRMFAGQDDLEFHYVTDGEHACAKALAVAPTIILQDLVMPGLDGFALIQAYRAEPALRDVPVMVLSSKEDPKLKAHSFAVGANDYMVKIPDRLELLARVRYHSHAYQNGLERDEALTKLAEANRELQQLAALDGLTGIANRREFDACMAREWLRGQRDKLPLSLLMCDVDHFKKFNDSCGHQAGDLALKKVAAILTAHLKRPADLAARYGGEEFSIVLPETDAGGAMLVAEACRTHLASLALEHPHGEAGHVTMSIGVATVVPHLADSVAALIARADQALYAAKAAGRNRALAAPTPE